MNSSDFMFLQEICSRLSDIECEKYPAYPDDCLYEVERVLSKAAGTYHEPREEVQWGVLFLKGGVDNARKH